MGQAVAPEDRLLVAGRQFAVRVDRGGILDLFPVVSDPDLAGSHGRLVQGCEREPAPCRHPDCDRGERRLVGAGVDVHGLQPAIL
jgi:hypothetical protein